MARALSLLLPALSLPILLAGCNVVGLGAIDPPPSATGAFDGSYFGDATTIRARAPGLCPESRTGVAEIGDKRLSFAYWPGIVFNPPVQPDGTLQDSAGTAMLKGKVTRDHLTMTITTPDCETEYRMHILLNRS